MDKRLGQPVKGCLNKSIPYAETSSSAESESNSTANRWETPSATPRDMSRYPLKAGERHSPDGAAADQGARLFQPAGRAAAETVRALPFGSGGPQSGQYSFQRPIEVTASNRLERQLAGENAPAYFRPENVNWAHLQRFRCIQVAEARPAQNAAGRMVFPRREHDRQTLLSVNGAYANKGLLQLRGESLHVVSGEGTTEL